MDTVTYSLRGNRDDSENYYLQVAVFTDRVLEKAKNLFEADTVLFNRQFFYDNPLSTDEGILELLILGVYWRTYMASATALGRFEGKLLSGVSKLRENNHKARWAVDPLKGFLTAVLLYRNKKTVPAPRYNIENFNRLILWLEASGEFRQEVIRLKKWLEHIKKLSHERASRVIASAVALAKWFEVQSMAALGIYTQNVEKYLKASWPEHHWKEDMVFCGQKRIEYHLNMVGAEIMNRVYREDFLKKKQKILLLPTCMRRPAGDKCHAVLRGKGFNCTGCSPDCPVRNITEFGKNNGLQVRMVPHESSIASTQTDESLFNEESGVIGVSCALNLISGGWMLKEKGVPAQCVLLDYCGCKKHWDKEGIVTNINQEQLLRIVKGTPDEIQVK